MEDNRFGLTAEERSHLGTAPDGANAMETMASLLAFVGLLLVFAFIVAASLIARSRGDTDNESYAVRPLSAPATQISTKEQAIPEG